MISRRPFTWSKLSHYIIIAITALTSFFCKEAFIGPRGGRNSKPCVFIKQSFIEFFFLRKRKKHTLSIEPPDTL